MSHLDLTKLQFGDIVEGERGDRHMVVRGSQNGRTAPAITLRGPALDRENNVGDIVAIYSTWKIRLVNDDD